MPFLLATHLAHALGFVVGVVVVVVVASERAREREESVDKLGGYTDELVV